MLALPRLPVKRVNLVANVIPLNHRDAGILDASPLRHRCHLVTCGFRICRTEVSQHGNGIAQTITQHGGKKCLQQGLYPSTGILQARQLSGRQGSLSQRFEHQGTRRIIVQQSFYQWPGRVGTVARETRPTAYDNSHASLPDLTKGKPRNSLT